ncbi:DUF4433 domain-containing protein [bacterium]|nr:DUF4433 domain-containing protein [bacterium]
MTIQDVILKRGIKEILHFTTNNGITGMISTGMLKARNHLPKEQLLEYVYKYNCVDRNRDSEWWDYINFSITSVNRNLFGISKGKWHGADEGWWCILSFNPEICCHEDVYFTTTNNMYTSVKRRKGHLGLEALFAPEIEQWKGKIIKRPSSINKNQPTCGQAELLYPREISLKYLMKVYVGNNDDAARFDSIKFLYNEWSQIPCIVNKDMFI